MNLSSPGFFAKPLDKRIVCGYNEGKRCGANLIDVMGDLFCKDPRELTYDPAADTATITIVSNGSVKLEITK